jgi:hypothetical protein
MWNVCFSQKCKFLEIVTCALLIHIIFLCFLTSDAHGTSKEGFLLINLNLEFNIQSLFEIT